MILRNTENCTKIDSGSAESVPTMVYIPLVTDRVVSKYPDQLSCRQWSLLQKYFNFTSEILQFTSEILKTALKLIQKAPNRFPQMVYILAVTDRVVSKYPDQLSCRQRSLLQKYFNFTSEILEFTSEIHKATANLLRRCSVSHRQQAESSLRLSDQLWFRHWTLLQCYFNFISFLC